jgi:hypothetical protein
MSAIHRLGKRPFKGIRAGTRRFTTRFRATDQPGIPAAPLAQDWSQKVGIWGMLRNDVKGCCVISAKGHCWMDLTSNASTLWVPADVDIDYLYDFFNPDGQDNGCDMQEVLQYIKTNGFVGHALYDFAVLNPSSQGEAQDAIALFGGLDIGIALPDECVQGENLLANPWDTPGHRWVPNPSNGHCVWAVAYDASGLTVVTWGELKRMSWEFYFACCEEAYALDAPAWFEANSLSPSGYTSDQLNADLAALPSVDAPDWPAVPGPSPAAVQFKCKNDYE